MLFKSLTIRQHERGLRFYRGNFAAVLAPGRYRVLNPPWDSNRNCIEVYDTLRTRFEHPLLDVLLRSESLREQLLVADLTDTQRAILFKDDRVFALLGPGRHAFWKASGVLSLEIYDIASVRFDHPRLPQILQLPDVTRFLDGVQVSTGEQVLLFRDGVLLELLGPGLHVFWKGAGQIKWKAVDRREQVADVSGQEIITSDKVTLRVNLIVTYMISDPVRAVTLSTDASQALYREAQLALRAAVGTRSLDNVLADKESVGAEVRSALTTRAEELGITVRSVGLRDIILPGDMKTLLNQVIAATKEAEANLIRRREETAAARSQANTAKLLAESPALARLKELEILKDVLADTNATFVLGPSDLTEQLRTLVAAKQ